MSIKHLYCSLLCEKMSTVCYSMIPMQKRNVEPYQKCNNTLIIHVQYNYTTVSHRLDTAMYAGQHIVRLSCIFLINNFSNQCSSSLNLYEFYNGKTSSYYTH